MTTYRRNNGSIITGTKKLACDRLLGRYLEVTNRLGIGADYSQTHVGDIAFEDVATAASIYADDIKGWNEFLRAFHHNGGWQMFVAMDNGFAYGWDGDGDSTWTLAFDPETLGESDDDPEYPVFVDETDVIKAARRWGVPAWLYEIVIETPERIYETGVFTTSSVCIIPVGFEFED